MVYLACYCGKHLSTYLHPVAITVEISKTDFCTCSSSQFSWTGSLTKSVWSGLDWWNGASVVGEMLSSFNPKADLSKHCSELPNSSCPSCFWWAHLQQIHYLHHFCTPLVSLLLLTWHGKKFKPPQSFSVILTFVFCFTRWHKENVLGGLAGFKKPG